jgi:transmembrane sensor
MSSPPSPDLIEHALAQITLAQMESPELAGEILSSLESWRVKSESHEAAYREALRRSDALDALAPALRDRFDKPASTAKHPGRNKLLSLAAAVLAAGACIAAALDWHERQPVFRQRYATAVAQLLTVPLPDGSRVDLSAQSAVALSYFRNRREAGFEGGEARFEVASDAGRPFSVQTREGKVEVVGTIFSVSDRGGAVTVAVEKGKVRFTPLGPSAEPITLSPGDRLAMRNGRAAPVEHLPPERMATWRRGWLVFANEPLADALPAVNAFRVKPIRIGDAQAAALRVTGSFQATESNDFVTALPQILPVEVMQGADGAIEIHSRR